MRVEVDQFFGQRVRLDYPQCFIFLLGYVKDIVYSAKSRPVIKPDV